MTITDELRPDLRAVLDLVVERRGVDFRDYRSPALERGLLGRLACLSCRDADEYRRRLVADPGELDRLLSALVVPVTQFFRDPPVFEALRRTVLPDLLGSTRSGGPLRAWVAGAATGEEAWSVAMVMDQACAGEVAFELVASDIDARSVVAACAGRYPAEALTALPAPLRQRYFTFTQGEAIVAEPLRERVRFAHHDLMGRRLAPAEAVVASFDLVSLRNVLIYFGRRLQEKALERLCSVIEPGGALLLGQVETLPPAVAERFTHYPGVDPSLRIFRLDGTR